MGPDWKKTLPEGKDLKKKRRTSDAGNYLLRLALTPDTGKSLAQVLTRTLGPRVRVSDVYHYTTSDRISVFVGGYCSCRSLGVALLFNLAV